MDRQWATAHYTTRTVMDNKAGSAGVELYCKRNGETACAANVIYWDASGHFYVQTFGEVPLAIL